MLKDSVELEVTKRLLSATLREWVVLDELGSFRLKTDAELREEIETEIAEREGLKSAHKRHAAARERGAAAARATDVQPTLHDLVDPPEGLVYWRHVLYAHIKRIDAGAGKKAATAKQAISYLKNLGDDRLPPGGRQAVLCWKTDLGESKTAASKTVANALIDARNHASSQRGKARPDSQGRCLPRPSRA